VGYQGSRPELLNTLLACENAGAGKNNITVKDIINKDKIRWFIPT